IRAAGRGVRGRVLPRAARPVGLLRHRAVAAVAAFAVGGRLRGVPADPADLLLRAGLGVDELVDRPAAEPPHRPGKRLVRVAGQPGRRDGADRAGADPVAAGPAGGVVVSLGRLHVLTDAALGEAAMTTVAAAIGAGAPVVQVRGKGVTDRELYEFT